MLDSNDPFKLAYGKLKFMRRFSGISIMVVLCLSLSIKGITQEISVGLNPFQMMFYSENDLLRINSEFQIEGTQWTDLDRMFFTDRFQKSMENILLNEKTELLDGLPQIAGYYVYLSRHPVIEQHQLKWPQAAAIVSGALMPFWEAGTDATAALGAIIAILGRSYDENNANTYDELLKMYSEGLSYEGRGFLNGTASKKIVADVTRKFFGPLVKGQKTINDPFKFDAEVLYEEQFVILEPFYSKFTDVDKTFIVNGVVKYSLAAISSEFDFNQTLNLLNPKDRVIMGLIAMGYSKQKASSFFTK